MDEPKPRITVRSVLTQSDVAYRVTITMMELAIQHPTTDDDYTSASKDLAAIKSEYKKHGIKDCHIKWNSEVLDTLMAVMTAANNMIAEFMIRLSAKRHEVTPDGIDEATKKKQH